MKIVNSNTKTLIQDADADTYVKTEASADEDKLRLGSGGTERVVIDNLFTFKVPLIGKHYTSIAASSDNLDVSDKFIMHVSTTGGSIVIGGLTGGVAGQIIIFYKATGANNLTLEHSEGVGDENIATPDGNDFLLSGYGGVILVFSGGTWFVIAKI